MEVKCSLLFAGKFFKGGMREQRSLCGVVQGGAALR